MKRKVRLRIGYRKRSRNPAVLAAVKEAWGFLLAFILLIALSFVSVFGQSGVLIPSPGERPDPQILSLAVMNVDILIDNQHATVNVTQIFDNHSPRTIEGKYVFALPSSSSISDFAVWDANLRIPGVMMEKRRANEIYSQIKQQNIDPGILQTTDPDESSTGFSARIFPIDSFGTKRLEIEYTEELSIRDLTSAFTFPLKPAFGEIQTVRDFNLSIHVLSDFPITPLGLENSPYPLTVTMAGPHAFAAGFHAENVELKNDFSFNYRMAVERDSLAVIVHRAPEKISAYDLRDPRLAKRNPDGFFEARAVFAPGGAAVRQPKNIVILLDTSLSMYGYKLIRAVEAVDFFLHNLSPEDKFNLILFGDAAAGFSPEPLAASPENVERAIQFVKNSTIGGGTNLKLALEQAAGQTRLFSGGDPSVVLISDASPTLGTTLSSEISRVFDKNDSRLYVFALGSEPNEQLLNELSINTGGFYEKALETEDISIKLRLFLDRVGASQISGVELSTTNNLYDIYPSSERAYPGSSLSFVGRYRKPQRQAVTVSGKFGGENIVLSREILLPELENEHSHLARLWARARVNSLLRLMNRSGEREDLISEIITLSEKYKFVTPYTAFLAAPRSLLRPRLIQPGDPVIRVKTDPSVTEVFAVLPFGETLPLKFLESEGVWETRFLAPVWMADGTYHCRLLLTDKNGGGYEEKKSFVVDSRAPKLNVALNKSAFQAGDEIALKVSADADTRRITARIYGAQPVEIRWSDIDRVNTGKLRIPENLSSGRYTVSVTAEDFAHNHSNREIEIEVAGK